MSEKITDEYIDSFLEDARNKAIMQGDSDMAYRLACALSAFYFGARDVFSWEKGGK